MIRTWCITLGLLAAAAAGVAADSGTKAELVGGTPAGLAARAKARLDLTDAEALAFICGDVTLRIPYRKVNTLEYGQTVSRRYAAAVLISPVLLLSKSRKHFVTLGYADEEGRQQALVLRINKNDIRALLASLEARTGRRVEYLDGEARKAGKG